MRKLKSANKSGSLARHSRKAFASAVLACAALPAWAELSDPPYFNLFNQGYGSGSNAITGDLTSSTDTVWLCGTSTCDTSAGMTSGYAEFSIVTTQPAGSGYIDPFQRLQHNEAAGQGNDTTEVAYNTNNDDLQRIGDTNGYGDTSVIDNQVKDTVAGGGQPPGDFNHAIPWSTIVIDKDGFMTFLLDVNEPGTTCNNGGTQCDITSTLRLDELQFFVATTDMLSFYTPDDIPNLDDTLANRALGNFDNDPLVESGEANVFKFWDMDFAGLTGPNPGVIATDANWDSAASGGTGTDGTHAGGLLLDNLNDFHGKAGSGDFDMQVRVPVTMALQDFVTANSGKDLYVYLYNFMGEADAFECDKNNPDSCKSPDFGEAQAGFEEWAYISGEPPDEQVPIPATAFLFAAGSLGLLRRRKH